MGAHSFGSGAGYDMVGVCGMWATRADESAVTKLYVPRSGNKIALGRRDTNTLIVYSWSPDCATLFFVNDGSLFVADQPDYDLLAVGPDMNLDQSVAITWLYP